jgi:phosphoglycolate phosphatase-like HAD superfamily hydrolase
MYVRDALRRFFGSAVFAALFLALPAQAQTDPLPSWNDTETKQAILAFVTNVTAAGTPDFVPEAERIAVFDMDGTLVPERPVPIALIPILADLKAAVADKPLLGDSPAIAALIKGDAAGVVATGEQGINDVVAAVAKGKTTEEVGANIRSLMEATTHPKFGTPLSRTAHLPMQELLNHLRTNGFSTWICSGSPVLFTRQLSQQMFGIPPQQVMGSNVETAFEQRGGRAVLVFGDRVDHLNDKSGKPQTINLAIGSRPLFVAGNEGGSGDIAMMRWSKDRGGPSFQLLVDHDDAAREYAYSEPDNYSLKAAGRYGFHVVSMKDDWKTIIAP